MESPDRLDQELWRPLMAEDIEKKVNEIGAEDEEEDEEEEDDDESEEKEEEEKS